MPYRFFAVGRREIDAIAEADHDHVNIGRQDVCVTVGRCGPVEIAEVTNAVLADRAHRTVDMLLAQQRVAWRSTLPFESTPLQSSIVDSVRTNLAVSVLLKLVQLLDWLAKVHDCEHRSVKPLLDQLKELVSHLVVIAG